MMATTQGYDIPVSPNDVLTVEPDSEEEDDLVAIAASEMDKDRLINSRPDNAEEKGKSRATINSTSNLNRSGNDPVVSGQIGGDSDPRDNRTRRSIGGIMTESRYGSGINTLDEPISETIMRDLSAIGSKMIVILYPAGSKSSKSVLKDWDLWGPLVACLGLAVVLSLNAPPQQSLSVFTGVFVIVWVGSVVVTLNARLLGGKVSLLQSLCVLGYCLFPLFVAALIALFIRWLPIRVILSVGGWGWSVWAAMNFFGGTRLEDGRALLAVYPLGLFYAVLAWITMLS
ncbi:Yip1 domain-containing protein [Phakopsora pachyrhizi]|uniref:Protein YIP n=1 Tax=Phakopsora pachyrhizi TaxID=170000 RepID=A0AAV0BUA6_PHAPC|nr:Yip1 domain-containing protein [Phakopsora pachyrhizi]CAH7689233.1 Yip1 domain-domain-containing protein [Phakopsora pachyrhizi]